VDTIAETAEGGTEAPPKRAARLRIWAKFAAGSVVATVLSQIAFTVTFGVFDASAAVASVVAFFAGAVPNYLLSRAWAWGDRDVRSKRAAVFSYVLVIAVTNLLAIGMTTLADALVRSHVSSHGVRTLLVDIAYLFSYGVMSVVKFLLFDGVVFSSRRSRHQVRSTTRA
jgi:putative flippase GtrA